MSSVSGWSGTGEEWPPAEQRFKGSLGRGRRHLELREFFVAYDAFRRAASAVDGDRYELARGLAHLAAAGYRGLNDDERGVRTPARACTAAPRPVSTRSGGARSRRADPRGRRGAWPPSRVVIRRATQVSPLRVVGPRPPVGVRAQLCRDAVQKISDADLDLAQPRVAKHLTHTQRSSSDHRRTIWVESTERSELGDGSRREALDLGLDRPAATGGARQQP